MIDWDDLRYYLIAAQAGTVTAAAKILKVSRTTVTRRVAALERNLGLALYELNVNGPGSTDAGRDVLACARDVESRIREMLSARSLAEHRSDRVRISVPAELDLDLMHVHDAICGGHTDIELEFVQSARPDEDLRERRSLIGLCVAETLPAHLKGVAVLTTLHRPRVAHGASGETRWIGWGGDMAHCASAQWMRSYIDERLIRLRVNSGREMKEAVRCGLGIGYLWDRTSAGSDFIVLDKAGPVLKAKVWLLMHEDVPPSPVVQRVMRNLESILREIRDEDAGMI